MVNTIEIAGDIAPDRAPLSPVTLAAAGMPSTCRPVMKAPVHLFRTTGVVRLRQGGSAMAGSTLVLGSARPERDLV